MSRRGRNWFLSRGWGANSVEWLLSTFGMWHCAVGTSKDACTLFVNSWRLSWLGNTLSSCHQASISSCCAHHLIHSMPSIGKGSGIKVHWRLSTAPAPARNISSPLRNSWTWDSRGVGTQGLLLQAWTNQICHLASFHPPGQLVGLFHTGIPLRATSGWWGGECYLPSWLGRAGWLGSPFRRVPITWHCLGDFGSTIHSLGSPLLVAVWASLTSGASATVAERAAHPVNCILQQCSSHQCPLVGISCYGQSFLAGVLFYIHEPIISGMVPGVEFGWGLSLGMPVGLHLSSSPSNVESHLHQRHSLTEWRISWQIHASVSSSQSIFPGNFHSW